MISPRALHRVAWVAADLEWRPAYGRRSLAVAIACLASLLLGFPASGKELTLEDLQRTILEGHRYLQQEHLRLQEQIQAAAPPSGEELQALHGAVVELNTNLKNLDGLFWRFVGVVGTLVMLTGGALVWLAKKQFELRQDFQVLATKLGED